MARSRGSLPTQDNDYGGTIAPRVAGGGGGGQNALPIVEYGPPIAAVFGTARLRPQLVYSRSRGWSAGAQRQKADGTWEEHDAWVAASVFAVCEAPIAAISAIYARGRRFDPALFYRLSTTAGTTIAAISETPAPIPWLEGDAAGMGFHGTAYLAASHWVVGDLGKYEELEVEVRGQCINSGGIHADPAAVAVVLVTNKRFGRGLPASAIDVDHGIDGKTESSYRTYCAARGIGVSRAITSAESASDLLDSLYAETNARPVRIGGTSVIVPWDDQPFGAYRPAQWNEATQKIDAVLLDERELLPDDEGALLRFKSTPSSRVANRWPVKFRNSLAQFNVTELEFEERSVQAPRAPATDLEWITDPSIALWLSSTLALRSVYCRNRVAFTLPGRWTALTPMDYVIAQEPETTGAEGLLCRIDAVTKTPDGDIELEAIETPLGAATPVDLTPQAHDGVDSYTPQPTYPATQDGLDAAQSTANTASTNATAALADLAHIGSDGWLSKGEKPSAIVEWNSIWAEWSTANTGLMARATTLGVSSSAYSSMLTSLSSYLGGLAPAWTDVTQDTPITAATWKTLWENVKTERGKLVAALSEPTILGMSAFRRTGYGDADRVWYGGNSYGSPVLMDPAWSAATAYAVGQRVLYSGNVYRCILARSATATVPTSDPSHWTLVGTRASQERLLVVNTAAPTQVIGAWGNYEWHVTLHPRTIYDNLDGIRTLRLDFYGDNGDGSASWMTYWEGRFPDRGYRNPTVDDHADNEVGVGVRILWGGGLYRYATGDAYFKGWVRASLTNSLGVSVRDFGPINAGYQNMTGGATIPGAGATPEPSTPPGTGTCVAPETPIRMADGSEKCADMLAPGDMLHTSPDDGTGRWGAYRVAAVSIHDSERIRVVFEDGRSLLVSPEHRVSTLDGWRHCTALAAGEWVEGIPGAAVARIEPAEPGPVVKITIERAHTYVSAGLLSHNVKQR
jgi:hypothetical protein